MFQQKDTDWLNGYKNKTHIYAVYRKPTSDLKAHRLKVRGWKNIFHANGQQKKKAGKAISNKQGRGEYKGNPICLTADLSTETSRQ